CDLAEAVLASAMRGVRGVEVVRSSELLDLYPVADYDDEYGFQVGHIPYTPAMFTALATMVARRIHANRADARQVLVVDGELHASLREFLAAQESAGRVLCHSSNQPETETEPWFAASAFDERSAAEKLRAFAEELGLGLDSFIFLSADEHACADVREVCA